uniref:Uncharacterized protein n=1 Tax=Lepeophtheirus salmonis TaxID=72036 RepID=A0A0K2TTA3_LEPSM
MTLVLFNEYVKELCVPGIDSLLRITDSLTFSLSSPIQLERSTRKRFFPCLTILFKSFKNLQKKCQGGS